MADYLYDDSSSEPEEESSESGEISPEEIPKPLAKSLADLRYFFMKSKPLDLALPAAARARELPVDVLYIICEYIQAMGAEGQSSFARLIPVSRAFKNVAQSFLYKTLLPRNMYDERLMNTMIEQPSLGKLVQTATLSFEQQRTSDQSASKVIKAMHEYHTRIRLLKQLATLSCCTGLQSLHIQFSGLGLCTLPTHDEFSALPFNQCLRDLSISSASTRYQLPIDFEEWIDCLSGIKALHLHKIQFHDGMRTFIHPQHAVGFRQLTAISYSMCNSPSQPHRRAERLEEATTIASWMQGSPHLESLKLQPFLCLPLVLSSYLTAAHFPFLRTLHLSLLNRHDCLNSASLALLFDKTPALTHLLLDIEDAPECNLLPSLLYAATSKGLANRLTSLTFNMYFSSSTRRNFKGAEPWSALIRTFTHLQNLTIVTTLSTLPELINMYHASVKDESSYLSPREVDQRIAFATVKDYGQLWQVRRDGYFVNIEVAFQGKEQVVDVGCLKTASDGTMKVYNTAGKDITADLTGSSFVTDEVPVYRFRLDLEEHQSYSPADVVTRERSTAPTKPQFRKITPMKAQTSLLPSTAFTFAVPSQSTFSFSFPSSQSTSSASIAGESSA